MDERRILIADTALDLIGDQGIRALTHHRVDDRAGLPRGSTSFPCRRRVDLLRLTLERLYVLDRADLEALVAGIPEADRADADVVAGAIAGLVAGWLTGHARRRSIARVELFMAASHEPELQPALAAQFDGIAQALAPLGAGAAAGPGRAAPGAAAAAFMLADGLMLAVLREGRPAPPREAIAGLLRSAAAGAREVG